MRLDRFLTLHLFGPLFRLLRKNKGIRIPILMYHSISDEPEAGHPYYWINTSRKRFYEQMKFLKDNNYKVISLTEAVEIISDPIKQNKKEKPDRQEITKYVVLTFDDGYFDFYAAAFPVLESQGFSAIVFLPTGLIGKDGPGIREKKHLNWQQVRELSQLGIVFGSHTVNHISLAGMDDKIIDYQIRISKEMIEDKIGKRVDSFSYPYRFPEYNRFLISKLRKELICNGYRNGVTTRIGTASAGDTLFCLPRLPISTADDLELLKYKLEGQYDWLHSMQKIKKLMGKMIHNSSSLSHLVLLPISWLEVYINSGSIFYKIINYFKRIRLNLSDDNFFRIKFTRRTLLDNLWTNFFKKMKAQLIENNS